MKCFSITGHFVQSLLLLSLHLCEEHKGFFLGCRWKRQTLVLFSVWGCVQINCTMIGCQNGKSCKLSMRIWICLCHSACGGIPGNNSRHGEETIRAWVASPVKRLFYCFLSSSHCILQHGDNFLWFFLFFFQYFKRSEGTVSCPAPLDTNCFGRGKLVWKLCCLLFKEKHACRRERAGSRDVLWAQVRLESVMKCSALGNIRKIDW